MAKCYFTGVDIPLEESYLLDIGVANRALRDQRSKLGSLERILEQLGPKDEVEMFSVKEGKAVTRRFRRLVCKSLADSLDIALPDSKLFISWDEYKQQRNEWFQKHIKESQQEKCSQESES